MALYCNLMQHTAKHCIKCSDVSDGSEMLCQGSVFLFPNHKSYSPHITGRMESVLSGVRKSEGADEQWCDWYSELCQLSIRYRLHDPTATHFAEGACWGWTA